MLDIQTMCSYIQKAAEAEEIDLDSEMIADFCLASDTYDSLTEDEQAAVNSGIREALKLSEPYCSSDFFCQWSNSNRESLVCAASCTGEF